jgi:hypothetical protein
LQSAVFLFIIDLLSLENVCENVLQKKESRIGTRDSKFYVLQNATKPRPLLENKSKNRTLARCFVMPCLKNLKQQNYQLN